MRDTDHRPADPAIHAQSIRLARRCRRVIQACLREEEWSDADREFYRIIRRGIEAMRNENPPVDGREGTDRPAAEFTEAQQGGEGR